MTKTPEELTAEWKAGKLMQGWYFCKLKNGLIHHFEFNGNDFTDLTCHIPPVAKILAPCNYDEYKAMQAELAEHRHYCCCEENEVMQLKLAKMEEKNKIWDELAENLLCLEEQNWENLVKNGTKEQRLDFLKRKEKYSLLAILDKYEQLKKELESARWYQTVQNEDIGKLRRLLKECKASVKLNSDITRGLEGKNSSNYQNLLSILSRISAALGESEE